MEITLGVIEGSFLKRSLFRLAFFPSKSFGWLPAATIVCLAHTSRKRGSLSVECAGVCCMQEDVRRQETSAAKSKVRTATRRRRWQQMSLTLCSTSSPSPAVPPHPLSLPFIPSPAGWGAATTFPADSQWVFGEGPNTSKRWSRRVFFVLREIYWGLLNEISTSEMIRHLYYSAGFSRAPSASVHGAATRSPSNRNLII